MRQSFIFSLLVLVSCSACQPKKQYQETIKQLEEDLSAESSGEKASALQAAYLDYVEQFPEDTMLNSRYLYRLAGLSYRLQDIPTALSATHQALEDYYPAENTPNNAILLARLYQDELRKPALAYTIVQALELSFADAQVIKDFVLPANLPDVFSRLDTLRSNIFNESTYAINFPLANDYITSVEEFSRVAPQHSRTPELLFKAAEIARSIQTYQKAIDLFNWLETRHPGHEREAQALFLKAFTLDDGLRAYEAAKLAYEQFIEKYPNDPFADDARFSLDNLGKDVEELINQFEAQEEQ